MNEQLLRGSELVDMAVYVLAVSGESGVTDWFNSLSEDDQAAFRAYFQAMIDRLAAMAEQLTQSISTAIMEMNFAFEPVRQFYIELGLLENQIDE